jgi:hypothetical protein
MKEAVTIANDMILCAPPGDRRRYRNRTEHFESNKVKT